jgi:hypothetical protein
MAEATWDMAGMWQGAAVPWRRVRALLAARAFWAYLASIAGAIVVAALVAALVENTILDPNVVIVGGQLSPDGKWVALTEQIEPGPAMGNVDGAIELRPHDGLLMGPTLNRTFLMKFRSDKVRVLRVRWYTDTVLEIAYSADADDIPRLIRSHEDVLIDYRRIEVK